MKPFYFLQVVSCALLYFFGPSQTIYGQCEDGVPSQSVSYDTLLQGGGNDAFTFNFPQFDPTLGTLINVEIITTITVKYSYNLENMDATGVLYRVRVNRTDDIFCSAVLTPLSNTVPKIMNTHNLGATDGVVGSGPDFTSQGPLYPFNHYVKTYDLQGNVAGFLGNGNVTFDYFSTTDSYPSGSSRYLYDTQASDSIHFQLKYYYCPTTFLPAEIRNFTAVKRSEESIQLNWYAPNDQAGNRYEIEKSPDGRSFSNFRTIISISNTGRNYEESYTPTKQDKGRIFFRIRQREENRGFKYSGIRTITLQPAGAPLMKVYPTVTTNMVNIFFPGKSRDDWQVNLISLSGQVVQQAQFSQTNFIKWPIRDQVAQGYYIVEAVNKKTGESRKSKIIVQR